jgi:putative membrane protein
MGLVIRIVINAIALWVAAQIVPNLHFVIGDTPQEWLQAGVIALVFGVINGLLKPIVKLLALPLTIVTLGLIGIVINGAMLLVLSLVASWLGLQETFNVNGFPDPLISLDTGIAAVLGAIITGLVAAIAGHFVPDR